MVTGKPEAKNCPGLSRCANIESRNERQVRFHLVQRENWLTKMITEPILWSENNEITGDTIHLQSDTEGEKLDSLIVFNHSLVVQQDSLGKFNQIKGKRLYGLFEDNQIHQIDIVKNAESIYYITNDSGQMAINKSYGSTITAIVSDNQISDVTYYDQAEGGTYPLKDIAPNARKVKGFLWRGDEKITTKADLLKNRPSFELPKIKGLEPPDNESDFFSDQRLKSDYTNGSTNQMEKAVEEEKNASSIPADTLKNKKKSSGKKKKIKPKKLRDK